MRMVRRAKSEVRKPKLLRSKIKIYMGGHNLGPRMACIRRFGKLVQIEVGGGVETDAKVWNWAPAKQDWL